MWGDENADDDGLGTEADPETGFVDAGGNIGENGTTGEDTTKEVGP
ncbi:hypothetical protein ACIQH9_12395 [Pseudarthrobacter oxydans]